MLTIPKELQQAMRASHGRPLRLTDPETQEEYVLLQAGLRAGWDDPEMDVYNDLDPRRQP
jgi:hypothetical protein